MQQDDQGYFSVEVADVKPGDRYYFMPENERDYPDPASRYQPEGVHGPSEVVDHSAFAWSDAGWQGIPFKDLILYELHVGTFTPEGTFEAIIPRLDDLAETGINALEIMPLSQFPGNRNWGYDGVFPYAVQNSYGGPEGFKKLVDACHARGIAVFLDVVYNHVGPEGNYFDLYGPYFTSKYCTPWGEALNFDDEWSDGVRDYVVNNALAWFEDYHVDGLRLDAIHTIFDNGAKSIWELLYEKIQLLQQKLGRSYYMIAESDLNSPRVIKKPEQGGYGFTAQWLDDFHHNLYVLLDKEGHKRYGDFGRMEQMAKAYTDGFVHTGEYVKFRKRRYGASSAGIPGDHFVVFNLNHDQVGNRVGGERLSLLIDFERQKLAVAAVMLSPYVPLLFMGEEYAEEAPFFYFVSHSEKKLIEAVQNGRREEFAAFGADDFVDPQDEGTFNKSKLQWEKRTQGKQGRMLEWHKTLIELRRTHPVLQNFDKSDIRASAIGHSGLVLDRQSEDGQLHLIGMLNFSEEAIDCIVPNWSDGWQKQLDSKESQWLEEGGESSEASPATLQPGQTVRVAPLSAVVYEGSTR